MMAASITGQPHPDMDKIQNILRVLAQKHEFMIVEGIGGLLVPITDKLVLADFAKAAGLPVIIVARPSLGTLNHTLLTVNACRTYNLRIAGLVINKFPKTASSVEKATPATLGKLTGIPILAVLPRLSNATYLSMGGILEKSGVLDRLVAME